MIRRTGPSAPYGPRPWPGAHPSRTGPGTCAALLPIVAPGGAGPVPAALLAVSLGPNLTYADPRATLPRRRVLHEHGERASLDAFTRLGPLTVPLTLAGTKAALRAGLRLGPR